MKRISIFLTVAVLASVCAVGYWYTSLKEEAFDHTRWLSGPFENVISVHVHGEQGAYMLSALKGGGWEAQVPGGSWNVKARALPEKVAGFLVRMADLTPYRSIGGFDQGGPEEYGLDAPDLKIIIAFSKKEGDSLTVKLSSDNGGTVYGWNSASPGLVYEFGKEVLTQLNLPATQFLDTRVFNFNAKGVNKVQLVQPFGSSWLVENRKEGYFFALPGYLKDKPASDSELKLYIHSLELLKAGQLMLKPVVIDKKMPSLTIKVWSDEAAEPSTVDFYSMKDNTSEYLGKSSWLTVPFTLNAQSVTQLVRSAFDVQGRTVVKIDLGLVARFTVVHGDTHYAVDRSDSGWRLLGTKKDLPGIDMFLWRFTDLQFEALPLNNLPETAVQLMYCMLEDDKGEKLTELTFYADPKLPQGQCWMKNGGKMYYPVSSRLLKDLQGMFPVVSSGNG